MSNTDHSPPIISFTDTRSDHTVFPYPVAVRAYRILQLFEELQQPSEEDSEELRQAKSDHLSAAHCFRSFATLVSNPQSPHSQSTRLPLSYLDHYLELLDWSMQYFLEFCLEENEGFPLTREILNRQPPKEWTALTWPTEQMSEMAHILDERTPEQRQIIRTLFLELAPKSYKQLCQTLMSPSEDLSPVGDYVPSAYPSYKDLPCRIDHMSDRILLSIQHVLGPESDALTVCRDMGILSKIGQRSPEHHYWSFPPRKLNKICNAFHLSPHWVMFGRTENTVLCRSADSELLMDIFQFIPETQQQYLLGIFSLFF